MLKLTAGIAMALVSGISAGQIGVIVDTAFVEQAIARNAMLWDVRAPAAFRSGHIPGAVNVGDIGQTLRDPNSEDFLPINRLEQVLGNAGIDPTREIVVYGTRGGPLTYFGVYTLHYFGAKNVYAYHDGIDGWRAAGKASSTTPKPLSPVTLTLRPQPHLMVTTDQVRAAHGNRNVQIVDARTPREYSGEDIRALRGGHIPGAINIPHQQNWLDPDTGAKVQKKAVPDNRGMSLKAVEALRALYGKLDPSRETIVYCQSGVRAAETFYVLKALGFSNVKLYDASWLAYGNTLDAPANNVTFVNIGQLRSQIGQLQDRVQELERELAGQRAAGQ
jgi:thiosulfate/3-mercaptopyruvate sulfurtransferase